MRHVTGIGGFFFHSPDPDRANAWYAKHLGIDLAHNDDARPAAWRQHAGPTVFGAEPVPTRAPGDPPRPGWRLNFRVANLDALVIHLRQSGLVVDGPEDYPNGRFAWVHDPDGHEVELWQPGGPDAPPAP